MNEMFQSPHHSPPSELGNIVMEFRRPVNTASSTSNPRPGQRLGSSRGDAGVGDESVDEREGTVWAESLEAGCSR